MTRSLALTLNALGLYAIALVLVVAFGAQIILHELPCPLCLLQRIQFALLAIGPVPRSTWPRRCWNAALPPARTTRSSTSCSDSANDDVAIVSDVIAPWPIRPAAGARSLRRTLPGLGRSIVFG